MRTFKYLFAIIFFVSLNQRVLTVQGGDPPVSGAKAVEVLNKEEDKVYTFRIGDIAHFFMSMKSQIAKKNNEKKLVSMQNLSDTGINHESRREGDVQYRPFKKIVILPFETHDNFLSGRRMSDFLELYFVRGFPEVIVVERQKIKQLTIEQLMFHTKSVDLDGDKPLSKILGADAILMGNVSILDPIGESCGSIAIFYRIVSTETGEILWADRHSSKIRPKLISLKSKYKSPAELVDQLFEDVAQKTVSELKGSLQKNYRSKSTLESLQYTNRE